MKRGLKYIALFLMVVLCVIALSLLPTLSLGKKNMALLEGEGVRVYYSSSEASARYVLTVAEKSLPLLKQKLTYADESALDILLYKDQWTMQSKTYGYLIRLADWDSYVGEVENGAILLSAPDVTEQMVIHHLVHYYTRKINPELSYWLDNGLATFLAAQEPAQSTLKASCAPSYKQTRADNVLLPWQFDTMFGHEFSYSYVRFLNDTYSWAQVNSLIRDMDYEKSFAETEKALYNQWIKELRLKSG